MRTRKLVRFALLATVLSIGVSPVRAADVVTGHHFIDAAAMKPSKFNFATTYAIQAGELRNIATAPACFSTGVNLPDGMTIKRVLVTFASDTMTVSVASLIRKPLVSLGGDNSEDIASDFLMSNVATRRTVDLPFSGASSVVDNRHYSYGFGICLGGAETSKFYSARITYSNQPPLD